MEGGEDIDNVFRQTSNTIVDYDPDPSVTIENDETDQKLFPKTTTEIVLSDLDAYLQLDQLKEEVEDDACAIQIQPSQPSFQSKFRNRDSTAVSIKAIDSSNLSQSISKKRPLEIEDYAGAKKFKGSFAISEFKQETQSTIEPGQSFLQRNFKVSSSRPLFPDDVYGNVLKLNARGKKSAPPQVDTLARSSNSNNSNFSLATRLRTVDVETSVGETGIRRWTNNNVFSQGIQISPGQTATIQESTIHRKGSSGTSIFTGSTKIKNAESLSCRTMPNLSLPRLRVGETSATSQSTAGGRGNSSLLLGTQVRTGDVRPGVRNETNCNDLRKRIQISTRTVETVRNKESTIYRKEPDAISVDVGSRIVNAELVSHKLLNDVLMHDYNFQLIAKNKLISSQQQQQQKKRAIRSKWLFGFEEGSPSSQSNYEGKLNSRLSLDTYVKTADLETGVEEEVEISSTTDEVRQDSVMQMVYDIRSMITQDFKNQSLMERYSLSELEPANVDVRSASLYTLMKLLKTVVKKHVTILQCEHKQVCPKRNCQCDSIELLDFFKKNAWTDKSKELVFAIAGKAAWRLPLKGIKERDCALKMFLEQEVVPLWPEGWVTMLEVVAVCRCNEVFAMSKIQLQQNFGIIPHVSPFQSTFQCTVQR